MIFNLRYNIDTFWYIIKTWISYFEYFNTKSEFKNLSHVYIQWKLYVFLTVYGNGTTFKVHILQLRPPCNNVLSRLNMFCFFCKVSHDYRSMIYNWIKPENLCNHNNFVVWPLVNPYINDQCKNIQCPLTQNANFRLKKLLHGALQLLLYIQSSYFHSKLIHIYTILWTKNKGKMINDVLESKVYICSISISSAIFIIAPLVGEYTHRLPCK